MKVLLFIQTLLALATDGRVAASVAESAVDELAKVVFSTSEPEERRRSALNSLALLPAKAKGLSASADSRLRAAFTFARESPEPEIRDFARRATVRNAAVGHSKNSRAKSRKVLVIHGHDELELLRLKELIRDRSDFSPVVVEGHTGSGRTFIERFEQGARSADFAIVLMSPDDLVESRSTGHTLARWSVLIEFGMAYAWLGRSRVCLLVKKGTKLPSELHGINRIDFANSVLEVSQQLQNELESAGMVSSMRESA